MVRRERHWFVLQTLCTFVLIVVIPGRKLKKREREREGGGGSNDNTERCP